MRNKQARNLRLFENCLHSYFSSGGIIKSSAAVRVGGALVESRRQGGCGQAALPGEPGPARFGALGTLLTPLFSDTKGIWCPVLSIPQAESECELCSGTGDGLAPRLSARLPQGQVTVDGVGAGRLGAGSAAEGSAVHGACLESPPHGKDRLPGFECLPSSLPLAETQGNADR